MDTFNLSIFSPERKLIENESVTSLLVTTIEGESEILAGHVDMVSKLETGRFEYTLASGGKVTGLISSGFMNIENNSVKVIAETLELPKEIDINRARAAQMKAEEMLTAASLGEHEFKKYQLKLQRAIIRQSVASSN